MPVEVNQWRATIGCFRPSMQKSPPLSKTVRPISILRLFCFCYGFIAISVLVLPLVLLIQFLALHCVGTQLCFLPLFARMHHFAKSFLYVTAELLKRIPLGVIILVRYKHFAFNKYPTYSLCNPVSILTAGILYRKSFTDNLNSAR